ncbi:alpha/beta fold hydrolase [Pseudosulfitobacter sp. DSM 107133]|jgi:pimeloyl-ACP methyl ester carboxylesterase|uniref:alpha/beta fold hydrolase n=1 Tax=Pseudosulfitobacter sp. DSM 107133 TaxID=2883100 RepID=UPI000DF36B10|nr:alpha/beta fold hydrolase [Pseudosulfitobacter sp. DSM 107133]UOA28039.1 Esterase YbfF [Pseudosulfitobacter sp. DSM 107133]
MLNYIDHAPDTAGTPLLIAHGLFGSGRNWGVIAKRLSDARRVIAVDMRNHGQSMRADTNSYTDMAADLATVIDHFGAPMDVLGHSMGGKAAMTLALTRPELVRRLIVADIAPVTYEHTQAEFITAMRGVDLATVTRRSEAAEQLAAQGVEPALQSFFTQSLDLSEKRWLLNLDALEANMPDILSFPELAGAFDGPALFLTGGNSHYVTAAHRPRIKELFPQAHFAKIPETGHWLHAEKPRDFEAAVRTFLTMDFQGT